MPDDLYADMLPTNENTIPQVSGIIRRFFSFVFDLLIIDISFKVVAYPIKKQFAIPNNIGEILDMMMDNSEALFLFVGIASIFYIAITFFYYLLFWTFGGQTPGKKIVGIKVVTFPENTDITFGTALLRYLGYSLSFATGIGFLWIIFDKNRQALHDKISRTHVIRI